MNEQPLQRPNSARHPAVIDIPLPGNYPCLTLQLNVTRYQSQGVGKMVLVVREPSDSVEVHRAHSELGDFAPLGHRLPVDLHEALRVMEYLQSADWKG